VEYFMADDTDAREIADRLALRALGDEYARAVDHRDRDALLAVFHPDGVLVLLDQVDPTVVTATRRGHEELGDITTVIARAYDRTFHFVGTTSYDVDGDRATGEVYCLAHHLTPTRHGGTDYVMLIRYQDTYSRRDGRWAIDERRLITDWTETHAANRP
jgi:ketosteroid isomerase-like protein